MSILHGASHLSILGGTQVAAGAGSNVIINEGSEARVSSAFKDLSAAVAYTALHDCAARFDAPQCHRNTRTKYLNKLKSWMLGKGAYYGKRLIWLHGGAGAGKSAIMQSVVERCIRHEVILGTFFFSRADPLRNYAEALIPTLAYQLARNFPGAMVVLDPIIQRDPLIFKASIQRQAYELLVRPLLHLIESGVIENANAQHSVFVIDGLDECSDPQKQALIINVIASIISDYRIPISFLLSSRMEVAIGLAFEKESRLHKMFASISLDDDEEAKSDIRWFIIDSFSDINRLHPLRNRIPLNWPNPESIDRLVVKSSGHFIYAATVMRFIQSTDEYPPRALEVVEGLKPSRTESPFAQLDTLYNHILTSAKYNSHVLGILRHCYLTNFRNSVAAVCCIYNISPNDVELALFDVQSLISLSSTKTAEMHISLKHASLRDFLQDKKRSHTLYISAGEYNAFFLARYFQLLDNGPQVRIGTSSFCFKSDDTWALTLCLAGAIISSQDINLLQSLINVHCPQDIWNFCLKSCALDTEVSHSKVRNLTTKSVCDYMYAIRESILNKDNALYIHQFQMYIELVMDDINDFVHGKPQYRIIPALMFSSNASGLILTYRLLDNWGHQFGIEASYRLHFDYHLQTGLDSQIIDHRSLEAIRRSPQSRFSWSSDLAIAMKLILQQLICLSWAPEWLYFNPHGGRWLRNKPLKPRSHCSPKLTAGFSSYLRDFQNPHFTDLEVWRCLERNGFSHNRIYKIVRTRSRCLILLKAVIYYLHKSACTSEVVQLAKRSLPKFALMFPKTMRRARSEMDAYVCRWEDSLDGLLEKAQLPAITDMD